MRIGKGIAAVVVLSLLTGCVSQHPTLQPASSGRPSDIQATAFVPTYTPPSGPVDAAGRVISDEETHYAQYISYHNIRIYENGDGTFLDAVCNNAYPETLEGAVDIVFRNENGVEVARAALELADGSFALASGENRIYAQINTDMNIQMMDFELKIKQAFAPVD